jgi:hypothetical protein
MALDDTPGAGRDDLLRRRKAAAMSEPHGIAIVCERQYGHTVAWVDRHMSKHVPVSYFTETWPRPWPGASKADITRVGTMDGGYLPGTHSDWYDAVVWCRDHAQRWK